ncbi:unnamed protein product [Ilex paraguariensis]|uniref:Uncharacterized protein n=1 Tax=Ilex paraguariensis TaxID=185542 RepID=A0ABC8UFT7_9AQUA
MVEHSLCMREVRGSIPRISIHKYFVGQQLCGPSIEAHFKMTRVVEASAKSPTTFNKKSSGNSSVLLVSTPRTSYNAVQNGYLRLKMRHEPFCTTVTDEAQEEGSKENQKISVTFKDGEEHHIDVPIGMSMLEAAHENDIELEGD